MLCSDLKNKALIAAFICFFNFACAEEECSLGKEIRRKTLTSLDEWVNAVAPLPIRTFPLIPSEPTKNYCDPPESFQLFAAEHSFFSCGTALVGVVTEEIADIAPVQKALIGLTESKNPVWIEMAAQELLTKVLAYRNLQKGMKITIPDPTPVEYVVDEVLDLWQEMPAFGLLPQGEKGNPILLFRGSDFSFLTKKSWASFLSDLDISGTGFSAFHLARSDIHAWLDKAFRASKRKTKVMGFSLGGVLSIYTVIFEKNLIASSGSCAFNPPGVSAPISERWKEVSSLFKIYVTQGDLIPKLGILVSPAFVLFTSKNFAPIQAHTKLMTAEKTFSVGEIYIEPKK